MTETDRVLDTASRLKAAGQSFALATVVRCDAPTSAKPGAKAIVTADGAIDGWIGGGCAQPAVIKTARQALADGQARLIRIRPEDAAAPEAGVVDFGMRCHSGGTLDIFIEPVIARPTLLILGASPAAQALSGLARRVGFAVTAASPGADTVLFPEADAVLDRFADIELPAGAPAFVVVATQGKRDEEGLEVALASGAAYIAFVASRRKAEVLRAWLRERGHDAARVAAIIAPAGVDIGAVTPEEIALSVLSGIVQARRRGLGTVTAAAVRGAPAEPARPLAAPVEAIDPVCGMTVVTATAAHRSEHAGETFYFCCARCRQRFEKEPDKYLAAVAS